MPDASNREVEQVLDDLRGRHLLVHLRRRLQALRGRVQHGLGARDDAMAMQFLIPGWKFDNKRPCLVR